MLALIKRHAGGERRFGAGHAAAAAIDAALRRIERRTDAQFPWTPNNRLGDVDEHERQRGDRRACRRRSWWRHSCIPTITSTPRSPPTMWCRPPCLRRDRRARRSHPPGSRVRRYAQRRDRHVKAGRTHLMDTPASSGEADAWAGLLSGVERVRRPHRSASCRSAALLWAPASTRHQVAAAVIARSPTSARRSAPHANPMIHQAARALADARAGCRLALPGAGSQPARAAGRLVDHGQGQPGAVRSRSTRWRRGVRQRRHRRLRGIARILELNTTCR